MDKRAIRARIRTSRKESEVPKRSRKNHPRDLKAKVALAAVRNEGSLSGLAKRCIDDCPGQSTAWKERLVKGATDVFADEWPTGPPVDAKRLHAKIGDLALAKDFDKGTVGIWSDYPEVYPFCSWA